MFCERRWAGCHDHLRTGREESPETTGCLCYFDSYRVRTLQLVFFLWSCNVTWRSILPPFFSWGTPGPVLQSLTSQVVQNREGSILDASSKIMSCFCSCDSHHTIVHHQASQIFLFNFLLEFSYQLDHCRCTWSTQTSNHQEKNKLMPRRFVMMLT